ncbi:hypothetical protein FNJ87_15835 [Nonlabens mediterrranea]|uniref:Uncharacterized protein n=1 Tax=Nonlabens mediterrranea TaxID=1419947 RepID=A0ABS0A8T6_9FLAO|nr:hypothetical protein [Nonlabens mediterrranea]
MKIVIYILMALAAASIIFNATKLDFSNLFKGDSQIAVISILASLCVFILLAILQVSLKIKDKHEKR